MSANHLLRSRWSLRALLIALAIFCPGGLVGTAPARAATIDPGTTGGVYGKTDPATVAGNDAAIALALQKITAAGGGELSISGPLAVSKTIVYPGTTDASGNLWAVPCSIAGNGADSRLLDVDGGVIIVKPDSHFPTYSPGKDMRQRLANVSIVGGGVQVVGGGKYFRADNVTISGVSGTPYGLDVSLYDGGWLDVNVHDCQPGTAGFSIVNSHAVGVNLTSRVNDAGGRLVDAVVHGRVYCEGNRGLGCDLLRVNRSSIAWWLEGNAGEFQARRRDCWGNVFFGQDQSAQNQGYDDDAISAAGNQQSSQLENLAGVGQLLATCDNSHTTFPAGEVQTAGQTLTIHPAAWTDPPPPAGSAPNWVEFRPTGATSCGGNWQAGDYLLLVLDISCDAPTAAWLASQTGPCLRFSANPPTNVGMNIYMTGNRARTVVLVKATAAGSGFRFFTWPLVSGAGGQPPTFDLNYTVRSSVRYLAN